MSRGAVVAVLVWSFMMGPGCAGRETGAPGPLPPSIPPTLRLEVPVQVRARAGVPLALRVRNDRDRAIELNLGGHPPYDFIVMRPDGSELWRWTHGQAVQDILEVRTLQPREELAFRVVWTQQDNAGRPVAPGRYLVRALLSIDPPGELATEAAQLTITR